MDKALVCKTEDSLSLLSPLYHGLHFPNINQTDQNNFGIHVNFRNVHEINRLSIHTYDF